MATGMQAMMNAPGMHAMMDSLMQNPEVMRGMFESNPAMRELMDRQPELAHVLNDPAVLRQAMDMARNPALLRESMRNNDRVRTLVASLRRASLLMLLLHKIILQALSNIETSAEGHNALRRLYSDFQAPLMDAVTAPTAAAQGAAANPFAGLFSSAPPPASAPSPGGLNATPLPNPWAPAPPASQAAAQGFMPPAGLGGMGMGGMPAGLGGMGMGGMPALDPAQMEAMLSSPAMSSALEMMASNPGFMDAMLASNPAMQSMMNANPAMRTMLSNPAALRAMMDPANLRAMAQVNQMMGQLHPGGMGMGGMGGFPMAPAAPAPPPTQLYATQLTQMAEMGFTDAEANVRALQATGGNVHAAVERLLGGG